MQLTGYKSVVFNETQSNSLDVRAAVLVHRTREFVMCNDMAASFLVVLIPKV